MRRRSRAGSKRAKSQRHKAKPRRRSAPESVSQETVLARRTRERDEALEQFSATSEILRVISRSPGDLQPVLKAMLENATRLCGARFAAMLLREGEMWRR